MNKQDLEYALAEGLTVEARTTAGDCWFEPVFPAGYCQNCGRVDESGSCQCWNEE